MKRTWLTLGALVLCPLLATAAWADDKDLEKRIKQLEQALEELKKEKGAPPPAAARPVPGKAPAAKGKRLEELGAVKGEAAKVEGTKYGSTMQGSGGLIYARPFVSAPKAIVGGYMDIEYVNREHKGGASFFDQHRLVPFIYGDVSDNVKFAAEIEIEHGEELKVEFATIDYLINEPVNLRAGIILLPLGKFNLLHDSPLRDLTNRPLVNRRIIPTTLHQPGAGVYGTFYPTKLSKLDYEFYVTSGFTDFAKGDDSPISTTGGLRGARSNDTSFDNNNGKSLVGRIAFSPMLGIEVGGSGFWGSYDPNSDRTLAIWAVDWTLQRGPFEIIGESAWAYAEDNHLSLDGTMLAIDPATGVQRPRRMQGYYIQGNYHFLPAFLTQLAPNHFRPEISTLTAVVRWEEINLAQDLSGEAEALGERQRLTLGLNFRPTEDTVMKVDFQYSPKEFDKVDGEFKRIHDTAFLASWATYF